MAPLPFWYDSMSICNSTSRNCNKKKHYLWNNCWKINNHGSPFIRLYKKEILKLTNLSLVFFMICDITVCSSYFIIKERNVVCMFWENVKNTMSCIFYDLMWSCYRGEMSHLKVYVCWIAHWRRRCDWNPPNTQVNEENCYSLANTFGCRKNT